MMLMKRRLLLASVIAIGSLGLTMAPAFAQSAGDALDQTFQGVNNDGSSISGTVNIPTLTAGSAVTGGGYMTIALNGLTVYSGSYTATTLKALIPPSAAGFRPIVTITTSTPFPFAIPGTNT